MGLIKECVCDLLKRRISVMLFISAFLLKTSMVLGDPISPPAEIGDILYQSNGGQWGPGHAMLYIGHYANEASKRIVEAVPPSGNFVQQTATIYHDISATTNEIALDHEQRRTICKFVLDRVGVWRYSSPEDLLLGKWKGQGGKCVCHGLTEAAYESIGLNPIPGADYPSWPQGQYESNNIRDAVVLNPNGEIDSPEDGDIVRNEISIVADIVSDTAYGSGIYKVEFFYDDNDLIGTDQHICNVSDTYRFDNWDTKNVLDGEYDLYLKEHDRGGNRKQIDPITIYIDNTRPTVTNKKP